MLSPQLIILNHQSLKQKYWPGFSNVTHRSPIGSTQEGSDILNMYDIYVICRLGGPYGEKL